MNTLNTAMRPNTAVEISPSTNISTPTELPDDDDSRIASPASEIAPEPADSHIIKRSCLPP